MLIVTVSRLLVLASHLGEVARSFVGVGMVIEREKRLGGWQQYPTQVFLVGLDMATAERERRLVGGAIKTLPN